MIRLNVRAKPWQNEDWPHGPKHRKFLSSQLSHDFRAAARKLIRWGHRHATIILVDYLHGLARKQFVTPCWAPQFR